MLRFDCSYSRSGLTPSISHQLRFNTPPPEVKSPQSLESPPDVSRHPGLFDRHVDFSVGTTPSLSQKQEAYLEAQLPELHIREDGEASLFLKRRIETPYFVLLRRDCGRTPVKLEEAQTFLEKRKRQLPESPHNRHDKHHYRMTLCQLIEVEDWAAKELADVQKMPPVKNADGIHPIYTTAVNMLSERCGEMVHVSYSDIRRYVEYIRQNPQMTKRPKINTQVKRGTV